MLSRIVNDRPGTVVDLCLMISAASSAITAIYLCSQLP